MRPMSEADGGEELLKEFIREMTLRIERGSQAAVADLRGLRGEVSGMRGDMRAFGADVRVGLRDQRDELRDLREESRAQTQALLQVLDRLEGGGPAPAT